MKPEMYPHGCRAPGRALSFPELNLSPDPQVSVELASETLVCDELY